MYEKFRVGNPRIVFFLLHVHSVVRSVRERKAKKKKKLFAKNGSDLNVYRLFGMMCSRCVHEQSFVGNIIIFTRFVYHRVLNTILICFVLFWRARGTLIHYM